MGRPNLEYDPEVSREFGTDKLTRRRELALLDGDCSALYVDASVYLERVFRSKDA